jgi:dipeptidyl aminopeptidase/acylaminoacyl peptidase
MAWRVLARAVALIGIVAVAAPAQSRPPVEAFGTLPAASSITLSQDGKYMAAVQSAFGRPAGVVYDLATGKPPVPLQTGDWILEGLRWAPGNRLIMTVKQNHPYPHESEMVTWYRAIAIDPDGKNPASLMSNLESYPYNSNTAIVRDLNGDAPGHILMELYNFEIANAPVGSRFADNNTNKARLDLVSVDLRTGKAKVIEHGLIRPDRETIRWVADNGHAVARIDESRTPLEEHLMLNNNGDWTEAGVFDASADKSSGILGVSEDGKALVRSSIDNRSMRVLERVDLATHQVSPLFAAPANDVTATIEDEWTGRIIGARYTDDRVQHRYFNPTRQTTQRDVEQVFPGLNVSIDSESRAQDRVLLAADGPQSPLSYYFLDHSTGRASLFSNAFPKLTPPDLGEMKPYPYKARDELDIPAYITLPPGKAAKNLPVVVMPHGGPDDRDAIGFDWWAQFLANRGYLVLQPNFRGSLGYGNKFTQAGLQQWGLKMQDDITDGVKKLIADGIADPKRICIVGASYGGYAALAGATFTPDLYACAVSWAGVSDLGTMLGSERRRAGKDSQTVSFWTSRIGDIFSDEKQIKATSPALNAKEVKCPILLMHGEGDTTVLIEQSEIEERALKAAHKEVTFLRFSGGEDHYMNTAETRIRLLKETEAFLQKYIGN